MYQNDLFYATCVFLLEEKKKYTFNDEWHRARAVWTGDTDLETLGSNPVKLISLLFAPHEIRFFFIFLGLLSLCVILQKVENFPNK